MKITKKTVLFILNKTKKVHKLGRVILNVSTLNQDNIQVSWQNCTAKKTKSRWYARLQYRLSEWTVSGLTC
jgi:hypothetical protein